jgi:hypothetical protein
MMILSRNSLRRANFLPNDFFKSKTADKLGIYNYPSSADEPRILSNLFKVADKMQEIRNKVGLPWISTSFYRCPALNSAVKGSPNSKHMQGLAADGLFKGKTPEESAGLVLESKISFDKMLIENGCLHIQFCLDEAENRNETALANFVNGAWKTKNFKS